jgi:hypothetical protein
MNDPATPSPSATVAERAVPRVFLLASLAVLVLNASPMLLPTLSVDDFQILVRGWTWERTRASLWLPHNEHAMPLGRLLTYGLCQVAGRPSALPYAAALVGPAAVLVGMGLVYRFVRREMGQPFYGLLAAVLFGVTGVYQQAVYWFSSSFSVLALDTLLLALLAAQRWRQTGRALYLDLAVVGCALAPGWFAIGILAGPLCCLYLLAPEPRAESRFRNVTFLPLLGSLLFLAVSLPRTAETILHLEHFEGRTLLEVIDPRMGLWHSCRSVVDNLLLGVVGITGVPVPVVVVPVVLALLIAAGAWWWWQAPDRRLLLLGVGLIGSSYLLTYSARAAWSYDQIHVWSRYHLLPQLGLVLFVCGGLPGRSWRWLKVENDGRLSRRQVRLLTVLIGVLLFVNLPRGIVGRFPILPEQAAALRHVEEVDARCREYHISAEDALKALPWLNIPGDDRENGWLFLRGSDDPRQVTPEEIRRLLEDGR